MRPPWWIAILLGLGAATEAPADRPSQLETPSRTPSGTTPNGLAVNEGTTPNGSAQDVGSIPDGTTRDTPAGRRVVRVMLDPGHGGSNPGARGHQVVEKQFTLELARMIQARLVAEGFDARLTRDVDRTMTLRERVELANDWPADLFVSLHGNASQSRTQRGFETYVLTSAGVDVVGRALRADAAARRDAGVDAGVAIMLDDIERGAAQWEAADLAATVQAALRKVRPSSLDRGVRQDAHHVLLGATMPAVLVEAGFLDHPLEGAELARPDVQQALADAIAGAIRQQGTMIAATKR